MFMFIPNPDYNTRQAGWAMKDQFKQPENDPERPPPKEPGDGFVIAGAVIGFFIGGVLGYFINSLLHYIVVFIILAGVFIGSLVGTYIGYRFKKHGHA